MTLSQAQCKFACMLALLIQKAQELGYAVKICELWRTPEQQAAFIAAGKSKTQNSQHLQGLAADLALFKGAELTENGADYRGIGVFWESLGGRWGGRFGVDPLSYADKIGWDPDHFELQYHV